MNEIMDTETLKNLEKIFTAQGIPKQLYAPVLGKPNKYTPKRDGSRTKGYK